MRWGGKLDLLLTVVIFGGGLAVGAAMMQSAKVTVEDQRKAREVYERCCSCTQAELGRCGR